MFIPWVGGWAENGSSHLTVAPSKNLASATVEAVAEGRMRIADILCLLGNSLWLGAWERGSLVFLAIPSQEWSFCFTAWRREGMILHSNPTHCCSSYWVLVDLLNKCFFICKSLEPFPLSVHFFFPNYNFHQFHWRVASWSSLYVYAEVEILYVNSFIYTFTEFYWVYIMCLILW